MTEEEREQNERVNARERCVRCDEPIESNLPHLSFRVEETGDSISTSDRDERMTIHQSCFREVLRK